MTAGDPTVVWKNRDFGTHISPGVLVGHDVYVNSGQASAGGPLICVDFDTGQQKWEFPNVGTGGLMVAGDKLIAITEHGEIMVGPATPEGFKPTARAGHRRQNLDAAGAGQRADLRSQCRRRCRMFGRAKARRATTMNPTRRQFMQSAAAASAVLGAPFILSAQQQQARKLKTALIGCGWWGRNILREAIGCDRCTITSLCDVDGRNLDQTQDMVNDQTNASPKTFKDFRELLDKDKPDIAIIATPDHWHALQTIAALKAGAHVYVEKPTGHTVNESRAVVKTARETGKVVQVGLHRRISPHHVSARKFFLDGNVGDLGMVRCFADSGGGKENPSNNTEAPEGMDWDMWCGPGPLRAVQRQAPPRRLAQLPRLRQRPARRLGRSLARSGPVVHG